MKGWKQAYTMGYENVVIVELDIPDDALLRHTERFGLAKDFYTCDKAKVASISSFDKKHFVTKARSLRSQKFVYTVGEEVYSKVENDIGDRPGIYFFKTREQAEKYEY